MAVKVEPIAKPPSVPSSEVRTEPPSPPAAPEPSTVDNMTMDRLSAALDEAAGVPRKAPVTPPVATPPPVEAKVDTEPPNEGAEEPPVPAEEGDLEAMLAKRGKKAPVEPKVEPKSDDAAPPAAPEPPLHGPKALREALAREKERAASYEVKLKELEKHANASKELTERLDALQKANEEMETKLRVVNYEQSQEYAEKFQRPLERAWAEARQFVGELTVEDGNGGKRPAKAEDFDALLSLNTGQATDKAYELFGRAAERVLSRRDKLIEISQGAQVALKDWREKGAALTKQQQAEAAAQRERLNGQWAQTLAESVKTYPELFGPREGDKEGNRMLEKGTREADEAFGDLSALAPEQRIAVHAKVRNRAAAWPREVWRRQQAEQRVEELEAALAEYEASKPGKGGGKKPESAAAPATKPEDDSMEGILAKLG